MKKILSLFIAVVMVASMCSVCIPAASAATLDTKNVGVEIPHFSGSTNFYYLSGKAYGGKIEKYNDDPFVIKEGTSGAVIELDGEVSEEEWGNPLISVSSDYAAQMQTGTPSAENTYYYHDETAPEAGLSFDLWMAWDESFLYIASVVEDNDQIFGAYMDADIWKNDALQIRIDPDGPNSVVGGQGYDASVNAYPWSSTERTGDDLSTPYSTEINGGKVMNLGVTYYAPTQASGCPQLFDMAPRYTPHRTAIYVKDENGKDTEEVDHYEVKYDQHVSGFDPTKYIDGEEINPLGTIYGTVKPVLTPSSENSKRYLTTYEIAIPWSQIDGSMYEYTYDEVAGEEKSILKLENYIPQIGDEFGISVALLNCDRKTGKEHGINSYLTWGSGICGSQMDGDDGTAGGSNSMVLSSAELGTVGCDHDFSEPTCIDPEVCKLCGYKRGFSVGHQYESELISTLGKDQNGIIKSTCKTCGYVHTAEAKATGTNVIATWSGTATDSTWTGEYVHQYSDDNGNYIYNDDGSVKTSVSTYGGERVVDLSDGVPGTYFELSGDYSTHSYKYKFRLTGLNETNGGYAGDQLPSENNHYVPGFYHWFGGVQNTANGNVYGMNYAVGFFPDTMTSTTGKFMITEAIGGVIDNVEQKVLAETESIDLGTDWHDFLYVFDDDSDTVWFYVDGKLVLWAWNEGFDLGEGAKSAKDLIRLFYTSSMIKDMAIGGRAAFLPESSSTPTPPTPSSGNVTIDGVEYGSFTEGETVTLNAGAFTNEGGAKRFFTYTSEEVKVVRGNYSAENESVNGRTYTFTMPAGDVALTSVYVFVGDIDKDGAISGKDTKLLRSCLSASESFDAEQAEAADVQLDGVVSTSDALLFKKFIAASVEITK